MVLVTGGFRVDHYKTSYFSTDICNNGTGRGAVPCGGAAVGSLVTTNDLSDKDTLFNRSEEHTSELQSLMRISYAVFCLKKKKHITNKTHTIQIKNNKDT